MRVRPLKNCAGSLNFRSGGPAFEVEDSVAHQLIADGAVEPLDVVKKPEQQRGTDENRKAGKSAGRNRRSASLD